MSEPQPPTRLARHLGTSDAVVIGLGSMIGAGVFVAIGPAARAAGSGLLIGLGIAALVAFCNATSSAQLAARFPGSGGTYLYGRERLGAVWGFVAGWGFVVGKTASCAAMALAFGAYAAPDHPRLAAAGAVVAITLINLAGVQKSALLTRAIVAVVLVALLGIVIAGVTAGLSLERLGPATSGAGGVLRSAGLLFFAFAGYARIATLGEEVRDPRTTIPRAIPLALGVTLVVYVTVALIALLSVGPDVLSRSGAPLREVAAAGGSNWAAPLARAGAAVASLGVLLSLLLGVSRTMFAMSAERDLPAWLDAVHPERKVPHRAEALVGTVVLVAVLLTDLRGAIGFSSFAVLTYYAITNAAASTLGPADRRWPRWLTGLGFLGCIVLAFSLPVSNIVVGAAVLAIGALGWRLTRR